MQGRRVHYIKTLQHVMATFRNENLFTKLKCCCSLANFSLGLVLTLNYSEEHPYKAKCVHLNT